MLFRSRKSQVFAGGKQWANQTDEDDRYVTNFVVRHINQTVAALYAKNPTMKCQRRKRLDYTLWDGKQSTLTMAMQSIQQTTMAGLPPDPNALALAQEIEMVKADQMMVDRHCMTLELLLAYSMEENRFKRRAKQWVRRAKTAGVAWCRVGYQREFDKKPETWNQINDITNMLSRMDTMRDQLDDEEKIEEHDQIAMVLQKMMERLQGEEEIVVREGLVYTFPRTTAVILDRHTTDLRGLSDCWRLTEEHCMTLDEVHDIFGVNLNDRDAGWTFTPYTIDKETGEPTTGKSKEEEGPEYCLVWEIFDRRVGMVYFLVDGCYKFLRMPAKPDVELERFFPHFALTFNEIDHDSEIYPPSDVEILMHPQKEYNRAREALRQHRYANRPAWVAPSGTFEDKDLKSLEGFKQGDIIFVQGLAAGQKVEDVLQRMPAAPIDQNVYTVQPMMEDMLRSTGSQEANIGPTSGATATETSIAENSRVDATASNVDDLDETLEDIARASAQILLGNMSMETVQRLIGPGAVWPTLSQQEIVEEVYVAIEAGSSGRPNRAQEIANLERLLPLMLQIPNLDPMWLLRLAVRRLDETIDADEATAQNMPAITALNRMAQPGTGNPATDPNMQGAPADGGPGGQDNAPQAPGQAPGPQPALPVPQERNVFYDEAGKRVA